MQQVNQPLHRWQAYTPTFALREPIDMQPRRVASHNVTGCKHEDLNGRSKSLSSCHALHLNSDAMASCRTVWTQTSLYYICATCLAYTLTRLLTCSVVALYAVCAPAEALAQHQIVCTFVCKHQQPRILNPES
jgi:hypothetical protein